MAPRSPSAEELSILSKLLTLLLSPFWPAVRSLYVSGRWGSRFSWVEVWQAVNAPPMTKLRARNRAAVRTETLIGAIVPDIRSKAKRQL